MKFNLNLASRRYVDKRALQYGFVAVTAMLLIMGAWGISNLVTSNNNLQLSQQRLSEVKLQLQELRGGPQKTLSIEERAALEESYSAAVDLLKRDAFRWTALLDRMEGLLPVGVSLTDFKPAYKKKSLSLSGQARSLKEMRVFLDRLLKSKDFAQVYLKGHSRIKVRDYADEERDAISFSLQLEGVF